MASSGAVRTPRSTFPRTGAVENARGTVNFLELLLEQFFADLHRIEGCAFKQLIA